MGASVNNRFLTQIQFHTCQGISGRVQEWTTDRSVLPPLCFTETGDRPSFIPLKKNLYVSFHPIYLTALWTVFLKPLILRARRARKIKGFRKTVQGNDLSAFRCRVLGYFFRLHCTRDHPPFHSHLIRRQNRLHRRTNLHAAMEIPSPALPRRPDFGFAPDILPIPSILNN